MMRSPISHLHSEASIATENDPNSLLLKHNFVSAITTSSTNNYVQVNQYTNDPHMIINDVPQWALEQWVRWEHCIMGKDNMAEPIQCLPTKDIH